MIDIPPQLETVIIEMAKTQGISPTEFLTKAVQAQLNEPFGDDFGYDFDLEQMQDRVKGYETPELALKNGLLLPTGKKPEELLAWLDINIPAHLAKQATV